MLDSLPFRNDAAMVLRRPMRSLPTRRGVLDWWAQSERRRALKQRLRDLDGIDPDEVIFSPDRARSRGMTATVCFPAGNLVPEGSVIKSTSIDPSLIDEHNAYIHTGPARVFTTEAAAIDATSTGR